MAISEAETSTAPVLLKENDIPEASLAGRKPAELGKANLLFWQRFKRDRESTARKTTVCFLMFTSNDTYRLATVKALVSGHPRDGIKMSVTGAGRLREWFS